MDIREALREHGATDQQIQAKVVDLIEEVLAEMSEEDRASGGVRTMVKVRSTLMNKLNELNGIVFVKQEESYTSKASFWDRDNIPVYNADNPQSYKFSGTRIRRGLYRTANGTLLNADVNGALNIMRKSSVVDLTVLYGSGEVDTPVRIRVA